MLPFDNRSNESSDAFFVDGIHDDLLTQLSKISALKVISRTSVEQFRDTRLPTKDIAQQLGVTKILEGGVQHVGDRVRINVQWIDADTDAHLWAESYDRELTAANIFAIQSEVAAAISGALKATLTPDEKIRVDAVPTQSLEAWEAYQLGKQRMARRTSAALASPNSNRSLPTSSATWRGNGPNSPRAPRTHRSIPGNCASDVSTCKSGPHGQFVGLCVQPHRRPLGRTASLVPPGEQAARLSTRQACVLHRA